jgi:hypothetical protein
MNDVKLIFKYSIVTIQTERNRDKNISEGVSSCGYQVRKDTE